MTKPKQPSDTPCSRDRYRATFSPIGSPMPAPDWTVQWLVPTTDEHGTAVVREEGDALVGWALCKARLTGRALDGERFIDTWTEVAGLVVTDCGIEPVPNVGLPYAYACRGVVQGGGFSDEDRAAMQEQAETLADEQRAAATTTGPATEAAA